MNNPFMDVILSTLSDGKSWLLTAIVGLTVYKIAQYGVQYQSGEADEKAHAVKLIRNTIAMGGLIFFLVWFGAQFMEKMRAVG